MDAAAGVAPFRVTHRTVLAIAVPMMLAHMTTPLLGFVDLVIIGRLGDAALIGGLGLAALIFDFIFSTFNFLRAGTTGLTAQALGRGDRVEIGATLFRAMLIAALSGLVLIAAQTPILALAGWVLGGSPAVQSAMVAYYEVRIWSAPIALLNYAILGWYLGLGRAGTGLALQIVINLANMSLSVLFVLYAGLGVAGAALGALAGEAIGLALAIVLVARDLAARGRLPSRAEVLDRAAFSRLLGVNRDIMIRSFVLLSAYAIFNAMGARLGDVTLAANALLMNIFLVSAYFLDGFATAAETLTGRAVGAGRRDAFDATVRLTALWGFTLAALASLVCFAGGEALLGVMTTSVEVRTEALRYLGWAALTPIAGVLAFQMDGVFIGATWSRTMRDMMLLSLAVFVALVWATIGALGNHGLWLAFEVFLGVRGVTLAWRCRGRAALTFRSAPA